MAPLPLLTAGQQNLGRGRRIPFLCEIGNRQKHCCVPFTHKRSLGVGIFGVIQKQEHMSGGGEAIMKYKIARRQAGVVLMEVLPLLTLLGITGLVFVVYSATGR